jgi:pimeloyl-ACP methyl ester carboxylesterase
MALQLHSAEPDFGFEFKAPDSQHYAC